MTASRTPCEESQPRLRRLPTRTRRTQPGEEDPADAPTRRRTDPLRPMRRTHRPIPHPHGTDGRSDHPRHHVHPARNHTTGCSLKMPRLSSHRPPRRSRPAPLPPHPRTAHPHPTHRLPHLRITPLRPARHVTPPSQRAQVGRLQGSGESREETPAPPRRSRRADERPGTGSEPVRPSEEDGRMNTTETWPADRLITGQPTPAPSHRSQTSKPGSLHAAPNRVSP